MQLWGEQGAVCDGQQQGWRYKERNPELHITHGATQSLGGLQAAWSPSSPRFGHQKAAEINPNQGCAQTSGFLPHSEHTNITQMPQRRGAGILLG